MKIVSIVLLLTFFSCHNILAQEQLSKFRLSGYKVKIVPNETFSIKIANNFEAKEEILDGNIYSLSAVDQRGSVPKDSITIYTNEITYLDLHNCELECLYPLSADSLIISMASSYGCVHVKANYLSVNVGAGGNLTIKGSTFFFDCASGAGSNLYATELIAEEALIDVRGQGNARVNVKNVLEKNVENGYLENLYILE